MDWKPLLNELRATGLTLQQIKDACGFCSRGHVLDLQTGAQKWIRWEIGDALLKYHKRIMRQKARARQ